MSDSVVFDPSVLDGLRKFGQADFIAKMIEIFEQSTEPVPGEIVHLMAAKDWDGVAFAAHSLKSGCGSLGLVRLTDFSGELENAAKRSDETAAKGLVAQLPLLYGLSCKALKGYLAGG